MAITYEAISTYSLSGQSTVTFSSIPQTYSDLVIHYSGVSSSGTYVDIGFRLNGDSAGNYYSGFFESINGSTSGSLRSSTNYGFAGYIDNARSSAGTININNYVDSSHPTQVQALSVGANSAINSVTLWNSNAAITSITFLLPGGQTFASPSVVTLYGIARA